MSRLQKESLTPEPVALKSPTSSMSKTWMPRHRQHGSLYDSQAASAEVSEAWTETLKPCLEEVRAKQKGNPSRNIQTYGPIVRISVALKVGTDKMHIPNKPTFLSKRCFSLAHWPSKSVEAKGQVKSAHPSPCCYKLMA